MPISTITVLALYGELRILALEVERSSQEIQDMRGSTPGANLREHMLEVAVRLRAAGITAERAAIEVVMRDAPRVKINPLTGEAG